MAPAYSRNQLIPLIIYNYIISKQIGYLRKKTISGVRFWRQ